MFKKNKKLKSEISNYNLLFLAAYLIKYTQPKLKKNITITCKLLIAMNRKILIALIAIVVIIGAGAFALSNSSTSDTISIDANALEDRGNLVVDSQSLDENNGLYHTDSAVLMQF